MVCSIEEVWKKSWSEWTVGGQNDPSPKILNFQIPTDNGTNQFVAKFWKNINTFWHKTNWPAEHWYQYGNKANLRPTGARVKFQSEAELGNTWHFPSELFQCVWCFYQKFENNFIFIIFRQCISNIFKYLCFVITNISGKLAAGKIARKRGFYVYLRAWLLVLQVRPGIVQPYLQGAVRSII